ncbi:MAG: NADH:ubiquinone oxidoreductase [Bacteroidota bacterium]|nr:NADH:ubiquinone oxidoreductase [Bacteroidota bacterium]
MNTKPIIGIFGLTSCAGDQLAILNCEDELVRLANAFDIKDWEMAQTNNDRQAQLDIAFVEGVVAQTRDLEALKEIRKRSKILVAIGTCAVWGGVAAMKNQIPREILKKEVYGEGINVVDSLEALPVKSFVKVDIQLPGCPIEKGQFLQVVASLLHGDLPEILNFSVCSECKMRENSCLVIEQAEVCCGALTVAGCNARCPSHNIPCGGCHGPIEEAHYDANVTMFKQHGITRDQIQEKMAMFAAPAWIPDKLLSENK